VLFSPSLNFDMTSCVYWSVISVLVLKYRLCKRGDLAVDFKDGDNQCHGVRGHRQAKVTKDGLWLLCFWGRGPVDSSRKQKCILKNSVSLCLFIFVVYRHNAGCGTWLSLESFLLRRWGNFYALICLVMCFLWFEWYIGFDPVFLLMWAK